MYEISMSLFAHTNVAKDRWSPPPLSACWAWGIIRLCQASFDILPVCILAVGILASKWTRALLAPCRTSIPLGTLRSFLIQLKMNGYFLVCLEIFSNPNLTQLCLQQKITISYSLNINVHCNQADLSRSLSHCLHPHLFYML